MSDDVFELLRLLLVLPDNLREDLPEDYWLYPWCVSFRHTFGGTNLYDIHAGFVDGYTYTISTDPTETEHALRRVRMHNDILQRIGASDRQLMYNKFAEKVRKEASDRLLRSEVEVQKLEIELAFAKKQLEVATEHARKEWKVPAYDYEQPSKIHEEYDYR